MEVQEDAVEAQEVAVELGVVQVHVCVQEVVQEVLEVELEVAQHVVQHYLDYLPPDVAHGAHLDPHHHCHHQHVNQS